MTVYTEEAYNEQLEQKRVLTLEEFSCFGVEELEVYESEVKHYRMRAEFRVWHDGDDLDYVMFNQATKERYKVSDFPAASKVINELMPIIVEEVKQVKELRRKLFQIDYLSSLSGEVVVSLLYHKPLTDEWEAEVKKLREKLNIQGFTLDVIGRARKQKRVLERDYVVEQLEVFDRSYLYQQVENSFTQPNGKVAEKMLEWAVDVTRGSKGDLLELYCGNGNFSIALAQNFDRVLATELAKPSVDSAQWNIQKNKVSNLKVARLSAEEFTQAMNGEREFRRLKQQQIDVTDYDFRTVFVDPPRAGMDQESVKMVQKYERILYISCNPETLKENIKQLEVSHRVTQMALFDQFPYTHHREVGVLLEKLGGLV